MPIMEITLEGTFASQQIINRWNYLASGTPSAVSFSFALVSAFGAIEDGGSYPSGTVIDNIRLMVSSQYSFTQSLAKDVYDPVDFYQAPFIPSLAGAVAGESNSPVMAYGFRTNRTRLDIRRATKRFAGVVETEAFSGGVIDSTFVDGEMANLASIMSQTITYDDEGNTLTFQPIVVGKEKYTPNPLAPEKVAYRYYETEAEQLDHIMTSILWEPYPRLRSQVSRQYGRGQ